MLGGRHQPSLRLPTARPASLRSLDERTLEAAATFPPDRRTPQVDVSTLLHPVILDYQRQGWRSE